LGRYPIDDIPRLEAVSDYLRHYAQATPDAEALKGGGRRYTYAQLNAAVDRAARALVAAGVGRGDRVATLSTPHPDFWILFLATASVGAIWLGLNPRYSREELAYVVGDADPSLILGRTRIGDRDFTADLGALASEGVAAPRPLIALDGPAPGMWSLTEFLQVGEDVPLADLEAARAGVGGRQACLLVYTSGTTGRPKGAVLHHQGLIATNLTRLSFARATPARIVTFLPINHVGCVGDTGCTILLAGGCLILQEQFEPQQTLRLMVEERATIWGNVPTTFQLCLDQENFSDFDLSALQLITWGGARMPAELIPRLAAICPHLATDYGMTETIGSITYTEPGDDHEILSETVGRPAPEFEVRIATPEGAPCAVGVEGEVQVRGPFVMLEYWRRPDATAAAIDAEGWLHTCDLAIERPDGRYRLVGRLSEMFKSGGYNVYPREVEQALEAHPAVAAAAVVGVADKLYGEAGFGFVQLEPGAQAQASELRDFCRQRLANYKVPKAIEVLDALPLLPLGKIDKGALRRRLLDTRTATA
jgi:acyl-CoA synthetase (AMP-forming)/AMP-acid ligase II